MAAWVTLGELTVSDLHKRPRVRVYAGNSIAYGRLDGVRMEASPFIAFVTLDRGTRVTAIAEDVQAQQRDDTEND